MNIYHQGVNQRGFGTWPLKGDAAKAAIRAAADVGYRAFDTAQMYENEADVWAAIKDTGLPRDAFCITTKIHPDNFGKERFRPSLEASIKALGGHPPDVLLLHWPDTSGDVRPSLALLQDAHDAGLAGHIGISNYTIAQMETACDVLSSPIAVNQIEFHPLINQQHMLAAASRLGIQISAYCPIVKGKVLNHPDLVEIANGYGKSSIQIALRWILQLGVIPLPMSTNPKNIAANFDVMDFTLSNVDMARISQIGARENYRHVADVPWAPVWDAPT